MNATVVVSAAIVDQGRILLVCEGKEICRGQWGLPGGRVEEGEPLLDAVVREAAEETGYGIRVDGMTRVVRYISQYGFHCVRFNFVASIKSGAPRIDGEEILDLRWFDIDDIPDTPDLPLRTPAIARAIINDVRGGLIYPVDIVRDVVAGFVADGL